MSDSRPVRVRIAPSPTGDPHVGTAYVALFNYLLAKQNNGQFVLRIEDTDRTRARANSESLITESLSWLGIEWDEGPDKGGPHGPYRQSERAEIYKKYVQELIDKGEAYPCFCTAERLDEMRKKAREEKRNPGYDRHCRDMDPAEAQKRIEAGEPYVVRLKMPIDGEISFVDELRGEVTIAATQLDDQVLMKSDGFPTYHLANVVDDHLMEISHVMRAEEWISSTPKHVRLYEAFGWEQPKFIHLPLLRNNDKSKISKRKNPVSLTFYQRAGILPEAMTNFLALMGWSYGDDVEIFSMQQMLEKFDYKNISLGGPVFDQVKLSWVNQHYVQEMSEEAFVQQVREGIFAESYLKKIYPLMRQRVERFDEFIDRADFFFNGSLNYEGLPLIPKGMKSSDMRKAIKTLAERFDTIDDWTKENVEAEINKLKDELGFKPRDWFMPIRLITTGRKDSPPLGETLEVLGSEMVRFRLRDAVNSQAMKS